MSGPSNLPAPRPSLGWRVTLAALRRLPTGLLSRLFGWLADRRLPGFLRGPVLGTFVRLTGIDMGEAERPLTGYTSVNELFVRRLRPGARAFPQDPRVLASPVDGVLGQMGTVRDGTLIQAKGRGYRAADLLGSEAEAAPYQDGLFLTIYLSPRHYHRIHTPLPGSVRSARHIPGALFPVNVPAVNALDRLFVRNERLLARLDTASGPVVLVAVGAYNVGRISAAFDPAWSGTHHGWITNRPDAPPAERSYPEGIELEAGAELMAFHLGSTVVLLTGPGMALIPGLAPGDEVRAGTPLARPGG